MQNRIIIPVNYAIEGTAFGNVKWRNLIEGAILFALIAIPIYVFLPLSIRTKIYASIVIMGPLLFMALHGINGLCLSEYVYYSVVFMMNRRLLTYPDSRAQIQRQKNLLKKKKQQMQMQKKEEEAIKKEQLREEKESKRQVKKIKKERGE